LQSDSIRPVPALPPAVRGRSPWPPMNLSMPVAWHGRAAAVLCLLAALAALLSPRPVEAAPPQVERHDLQCGDAFACPPEIRRRVDFWIKVFRAWGTDQLVFHDRASPARVYSVITSEHSCRHARPGGPVEAERERVENMLRTVARKASWAEPGWTEAERAYLALFPGRDPDEIRRAAKRVRCQQGNRDRFQQALQRYGRYRNRVLEVLREHELSQDLLYLPFVESAYNPRAYSRAGAAGLWQIMPATARQLGLQLDATLDERFDPERATLAAARYLRNSTDRLTKLARQIDPAAPLSQINPFVITSYNYGVTGMARAMRSVGPDYIELLDKYRSRSFRTAVRNFYASFLAARYVARNADKYFGPIQGDPALRLEQVVLERPTSADRIVAVFGLDRETVKRLNPALTRYIWKGWRLIPSGYALNLPARDQGWSARITRLKSLPAEAPQLSGRQYVVERGDTACEIARAFAVSCKDLVQLNGLGRRALIRVGQELNIPGKPRPSASQRVAAAEDGYYEVRRGDTACEIARSFEVDCKALMRVNGLGDRGIIHIGQKLQIPGRDTGAARVAAAGHYEVRPGDTPCEIAASFEVDCKALMHANGLRDSTPIRVGQQLAIPGRAAGARTVAAAERYYEVRQGDTPCEIAESFHVGCKALMRANGLADGTLLRIGQKLELPGRGAGAETVAGAAAEAERTVAAEEPVDVASAAPAPEQRSAGAVPPASGAAETGPVVELMEEIDVSVNVTRDGDATAYRIRVLPGETLGHYADWLGLGGTAALRRLNDLPYGTGLRLDTVVELPIDSDAERASFETSRFEYHQTLVDEFNQHYEVTDVRGYTVKLGDTMWKIARRHNLPYWVLSRANRDVSNPGVGETVDVPVIEARSEANQPLVDTN